MPLISVPAVYDGERVRFLETPPVSSPYRVLVTFVEPTEKENGERAIERFRKSLGAWQDDRPIEETIREIIGTRRSRTQPPNL